ncbi:MAG: hypothetical protein A4E48_00292 [Methanosaeta sp. PtaU1.Bin060]|nr:MAG: hypothetical protein A4E48_00292 [Methanosaeta sp. PtaU1.Bin060]
MSRKESELLSRLEQLESKLTERQKKIEELEQRLSVRPASPLMDVAQDVATYEGILDLLVLKGHATDGEIQHSLDTYKSFWSAIVHLLIDKGLLTEKELWCATIAYHHFLRLHGLNSGKSAQELMAERREFIKKISKLEDPFGVI